MKKPDKESSYFPVKPVDGWWAVIVINPNKSPNRGPNAVGENVGFIFLSAIRMVS